MASGLPAVPRGGDGVAQADRGDEEDTLIRSILSTSGSRPASLAAGAMAAVMSRRAFLSSLAGAGLAAPFAAGAQQPARIHRVGMIERTSIAINAANVQGFRQGLRELGYAEGESFAIEYRSADGQDGRFPGLAAELVRLKVDLLWCANRADHVIE
jgi:hypothetical protein